ncbi:Carbamoyl-phosphate synthase small chain [bacterium HR36]|nr:Carbamoyl-phosphate synthase small chain [bacterium HR36]
MTKSRIACKLALEDGVVFSGYAFGATGERFGEVVFNTSITGYQEILTDPSYKGQIVVMTYPHIGNYGVNMEDRESWRPQVEGFVVREVVRQPSNCRAEASLEDYLREHGIIGLEGVDTRALVRHIRIRGAMRGVLSTEDLDDASLVRKAQSSPSIVGRDLVREVLHDQPYTWQEGFTSRFAADLLPARALTHQVVALDFGMKWNILRCLVQAGCRVTVLPGTATAEEVLRYNPDGIFLSNGPGDPAALDYAIQTIRQLLGKKPIFGICLGHQLLGLALGAETFKLKFGHRGANHPVLNYQTNRVEITTQNHGFAVRLDTLPPELEPTHINLNDQTLEGMRHRKLPIFSVQYHPEASAGPHDSYYLFEHFRQLMG